jgi:hypothetical protein
MSSAAQILANGENAQHSTGPRTAEGKETSSRNALATGLFTTRDFILPAERAEYEAARAGLWAEIHPQGIVEETLAAAVLTATWRLRRCGLVESNLAAQSPLDPMECDPASPTARTQLSVDRARNQALNQLHRALAELRRLQTDKAVRREIFETPEAAPTPDLASYKEVLSISFKFERARHQFEAGTLGSNCRAA